MVPPTEPCALRSTQPLKVSTRDLSRGKGGRCVWLTTYHPCSAETSRKSGALNYPEPLGPPRPVAGDLYLYFIYLYISCLLFLPDFNKNLKFLETFPKDPQIRNFTEIRPMGTELFHADIHDRSRRSPFATSRTPLKTQKAVLLSFHICLPRHRFL